MTPQSTGYTIHFDANGGTGSMADESIVFGVAATLTPNAYSREGYVFAGWTTNADGSGTTYKDEESVMNLIDENGGTVTLYAIWEKNPTPTPTPAASKTVTKTVTETVEYLPETGDDVPLVPIAITAAAALSFGMLALYRRRRND